MQLEQQEGKRRYKLKERDLQLFRDLYFLRTLTTQQINRLYFQSSADYVYRKITWYVKNGYLTREPLVNEKGRRETKCLYLTDKAIAELIENGLLPVHVREARRNRDGRYRRRAVEIAEIHIGVVGTSWTFIEGREIKHRYSLDRSSILCGALRDEKGFEHVTYLIESDYPEAFPNFVMDEIRKLSYGGIKRVVLFFKDPQRERDFHDLPTVLESYMRLPYVGGPQILSNFRWDDPIFAEQVIRSSIQDISDITPLWSIHPSGFQYQASFSGTPFIIGEYVTKNYSTLRRIRAYTREIAENYGDLLLLVGTKEDGLLIKEMFAGWDHIHPVLANWDMLQEFVQ